MDEIPTQKRCLEGQEREPALVGAILLFAVAAAVYFAAWLVVGAFN